MNGSRTSRPKCQDGLGMTLTTNPTSNALELEGAIALLYERRTNHSGLPIKIASPNEMLLFFSRSTEK